MSRFLLAVSSVTFSWPTAGQENDALASGPNGGREQEQATKPRPDSKAGPSSKDKEDRGRSPVETLKGKAKVSVHSCKMEKGNTYRITVKGDGFTPRVHIEGQSSGILGTATGSPLDIAMASPANPNPRHGPNQTSQLLFTPQHTKEYQIKVDYLLGPELGKGPLSYSLTIERSIAQPHFGVKEAPLELSEVSQKLEQGKLYSIMVTGRGFVPEVQIVDGRRSVATAFNGRWFGFGPDAECITTLTFAPARTTEYRILIGVGPLAEQRKAPPEYATQVVELQTALSVNERLTKQEPAYPQRGGPHKVHTVRLEAGKNYEIAMTSRAFDSYLFLEDSAGKVLLEDDDGGEALNARLVFRPVKTDTYRIVATTFERGAPSTNPGAYTLTVVENPHAQLRFRAAFPSGKGFADFPK
jgi:hypothetical protein